MQEKESIETGVDAMLKILEAKGKIELSKLAKEVNTSASLVEEWVKFLVEEHILGIDYKFTTPYVYIVDKEKDNKTEAKIIKQPKRSKYDENDNYTNNIPMRWDESVKKILLEKEEFFFKEAESRELTDVKELWENYKKRVIDEFQS